MEELDVEAVGSAAVERIRQPVGRSVDDEDRTMQALHDAILEALFSGGVLPEDMLEQLLGEPADGDQDGARAAARRADPADHRAHDGAGFITDAARPRAASGSGARQGGGGEGERPR